MATEQMRKEVLETHGGKCCAGCRFFDMAQCWVEDTHGKMEDIKEENMGLCRRLSPPRHPDLSPWPAVGLGDWCGEYEHGSDGYLALETNRAGMETTPGMWQMLSETIAGEKLPESLNKAILALCDGSATVTPVAGCKYPA